MLDSVSLSKLESQELVLSCCCAGLGMDQISNHTTFSSTQRNGAFYHSCNKTILWLFINIQFSIDTVLAWGHFKLSRIVNPVWKLVLFHKANHCTKTRVMNCLTKVRHVLWQSDLRPIKRFKTSLAATELFWIVSWNRTEYLG